MPEAEASELMEIMNSTGYNILRPHYKDYGPVEMQKDGGS